MRFRIRATCTIAPDHDTPAGITAKNFDKQKEWPECKLGHDDAQEKLQAKREDQNEQAVFKKTQQKRTESGLKNQEFRARRLVMTHH